MLWQGGRLVLAGQITAGELVSFLLYAVQVAAAITALASLWGSYQQAQGAAIRGFDLMEEFRCQVVDRVVIAALRRQVGFFQLNAQNLLTKESRQRLIELIGERLKNKEEFRGKRLSLEQIIREQVKALKNQIVGKSPYKPYVAKW